MPRKEIEGEFVRGWPDRKRARPQIFKDVEGRVVSTRMPLLEMEGLITPTDASYILAQLQVPDPVHPEDYEFSVFGEVENPGTWTLEDVRRLPGRSVRAVIECAGNDADFFDYLEAGSNMAKPSFEIDPEDERLHWSLSGKEREDMPEADDLQSAIDITCLVSGGEWTGVPLHELLDRVGLKSNAVAIRFEGWDEGRPDPIYIYRSVGRTDFEVFDPGIINFDKGLPIAKALHPDTILAWAQNGEWLQHLHGAPLRLIVPGWAGNWWVKWIHKIEVMDHMPDCYHQTHYFVDGKSPDDPDKKMMTALGVKSIITDPQDHYSPLPRGSHMVRGLAWSGEGEITGVEVSLDEGQSWRQAHVEYSPDRWLWKRWSYLWEVDKPGDYTILARARDETERMQPQTEWNFMRKHFDGIVPTRITIE
ncbi:MAG: molybdopterin-dependent oxidoreductase [Alphaproteobacteria bacterium]|jgi:DMSO/TMAO reductase YedYZ molybdopterin-dependent catalytic subunit|nr:molybdopterin-dependent oxidoreductase [Alphaproteobacteria bacterium]